MRHLQHKKQEGEIKAGALIENGCACDSALSNEINADCHCGSPSFVFLPPLVDLHVHFRVPGNPEKETVLTGSMAAKAGGYGLVCTMPNLNPAPDCLENLRVQLDLIKAEAQVEVLPFGCITKGRKGVAPAEYEEMMPFVAGFSDDGSGVESDEVMEECMRRIAALDGLIVTHCEKGCGDDREREYTEVERNIRLAGKTGCRLHLCHISTKESIEFIRKGKAEGVRVTCETAPHYLCLSQPLVDADGPDGGRFRMNPPIGREEDRLALVEALKDGTIDVIATDHAPHTEEEKSGGFAHSLNGVVGLESAFPVMYTQFVKTGIITLERLTDLMSRNGRMILRLPETDERIKVDIAHPFRIDSSTFKSKGRSCPFDGMEVVGKVIWS